MESQSEQEALSHLLAKGAIHLSEDGNRLIVSPKLTEILLEDGKIDSLAINERQICGDW